MLNAFALTAMSLLSVVAFDQVGPCSHPDCPCVNIVVCHTAFGTQAVVRNPCTGGVKYYGLGMGSTKVLHYGGANLFPCGDQTWSDVNECEDIWITCS